MLDGVWRVEGTDHGAFAAFVAAVCHFEWEVMVDGVANHHVNDMTGCDPDGHEDSEGDVTSVTVAQVFQAFCYLFDHSVSKQ